MTSIVDSPDVGRALKVMRGKATSGRHFEMRGHEVAKPLKDLYGDHRPDPARRCCIACGSSDEDILDNVVGPCAYATMSLESVQRIKVNRQAVALSNNLSKANDLTEKSLEYALDQISDFQRSWQPQPRREVKSVAEIIVDGYYESRAAHVMHQRWQFTAGGRVVVVGCPCDRCQAIRRGEVEQAYTEAELRDPDFGITHVIAAHEQHRERHWFENDEAYQKFAAEQRALAERAEMSANEPNGNAIEDLYGNAGL